MTKNSSRTGRMTAATSVDGTSPETVQDGAAGVTPQYHAVVGLDVGLQLDSGAKRVAHDVGFVDLQMADQRGHVVGQGFVAQWPVGVCRAPACACR